MQALARYGIQCKYTPKAHPELNGIEYVWAEWKLRIEYAHGVEIDRQDLSFKERLDRHLNNISAVAIGKCCWHANLLLGTITLPELMASWPSMQHSCT